MPPHLPGQPLVPGSFWITYWTPLDPRFDFNYYTYLSTQFSAEFNCFQVHLRYSGDESGVEHTFNYLLFLENFCEIVLLGEI